MCIDIRKVLPENAYEYAALHIACWRDAYKGIISDEYLENMSSQLDQLVERCRQTINEPDGCEYLYAVYGSEMIGRLVFSGSRDEDKPDAGEVHAIYLLADYWGKGYGKQMMDFAVSALRHAGFREIIVWVLEENNRARRFYEKYGFVYDGTRKEIDIGETLVEIRYTLKIDDYI